MTSIQTVSPFSLGFTAYLPPDAEERLKRYKYKGEDRSYLYRYIFKPLCHYIVHNILPDWLHPNVITFIGLIPVIITYSLFQYYCPDFVCVSSSNNNDNHELPPTPSWIFLFAAFSLIFYVLADDSDGIQARRLNLGSPLGCLVDHGIDGINTVFNTLSIASAVGLGSTWKTLAAIWIAVVVFHLATMEENFTGSLILPEINGVNEGIMIVFFTYVVTFVKGPSFWLEEVQLPFSQKDISFVTNKLEQVSLYQKEWFQCSKEHHNNNNTHNNHNNNDDDMCIVRNSIMLTLMLTTGIATCFLHLFNIYRTLNQNKKKEKDNDENDAEKKLEVEIQHGITTSNWFIDNFPFSYGLSRLLPLFFLSISTFLWFFNSPSNIFEKQTRIFCWTFALLVTKLTLLLIVSHMLNLDYHPFRRTLLPFFFISMHCLLLYLMEKYMTPIDIATEEPNKAHLQLLRAMNETVLLIEFFVIALSSYLHGAVNIVYEVSRVLKLNIIFVPKKKD